METSMNLEQFAKARPKAELPLVEVVKAETFLKRARKHRVALPRFDAVEKRDWRAAWSAEIDGLLPASEEVSRSND